MNTSADETLATALFIVLLHRHSGQAEFSIGVHSTPEPECPVARLVHVELSDSSMLSHLIEQVRSQLRCLPMVLSAPKGEAAPNVVLVFGSELVDGNPPTLEGGAELVAELDSSGGRATFTLRYSLAAFSEGWIREFADQYVVLAREVAASPDRLLGDFNLLTDRGRALLPDPTAALETPYHAPIADTIMAWSRRTPTAAAVSFENRCFSFADLARLSDEVACTLVARGVGAGETVAVTGIRSFGLIGAMLGVLRSGGVLLMLDPSLPLLRKRAMVELGGARMIVRVDRDHDAADAPDFKLPTLDIDIAGHRNDSGFASTARSIQPVDPSQPAYVFFTSGSTGTPKAVKGRHAGLAHFLDWQREAFGVGPGDRASQLTALSFDVVLRDTFLALTAGATLYIPAEGDVLDPARILLWLEASEVTIIHIVPSLARMWLDHVPEGVTLKHLRHVFFAGEPLSDVLVQRWRKAFPGPCEIVNLYGPTETTLAKCFYRVPEQPERGVQPIGQALPQTQVLILDGRRRLRGLNEAGEIAIRTPFRSLGYLGNPQANEAAFIRNPYRDDAEDLLYLTGDSGRYRDDGVLEIHGRIDNQVKIRGVRIEPGEIEACLARHPSVRATVVVAGGDTVEDKFLVAYVVASPEAAAEPVVTSIDGYRRFLRERLPEIMVPSLFVHLDALPLNANGKVDKRALPVPDPAMRSSAEYAAPQSELQRNLAAVWCELLNLRAVGIDDNFFDIGGHSLLAVQLVRKIGQDLGLPCSLPDLFCAPTVRGLSVELTNGKAGGRGPLVIPLQLEGSAPALFCICGVHLYQELAEEFAPETPVYGIFLPSEERLYDAHGDKRSATLSVEDMAAGYVEAVRTRQPHGPYWLTGVSFGGVLAYEVAQQLVSAGEEVAFLAMLDSMLPRALKRNWLRWAREHVRRASRRGWRDLARRVKHRFKSPRRGVTEPNLPIDENQRLAALRQAFYSEATRRYAPRPYGSAAMLVRAEDKGFFESDIADPTYGWGALVRQLVIFDAPGNHLGILVKPNVVRLAEQLRSEARRATSLQLNGTKAANVALHAVGSLAAAISAQDPPGSVLSGHEGDRSESVETTERNVMPPDSADASIEPL